MYFYERAKYPHITTTPVIVTAIAAHETGNFTADLFQTRNNCFGMRTPNKRETTCTNKGQGGFAVFDSVMDSVEDFLMWQEEFGLTDDGKLDAFIKAGRYCPDKGYYEAINRMIASLQTSGKYLDYDQVKAYALGGGLLVGGAAYAAYKEFAS